MTLFTLYCKYIFFHFLVAKESTLSVMKANSAHLFLPLKLPKHYNFDLRTNEITDLSVTSEEIDLQI